MVKLLPVRPFSMFILWFQSLSRDSWWSNFANHELHLVPLLVSIPQSGFLVVKPTRWPISSGCSTCFNPSVGILGGQTQQPDSETFPCCTVSIPQSGFLVVKLAALAMMSIGKCQVSIPQSGFLVVKRSSTGKARHLYCWFQSLSRDSWWSNFLPGVDQRAF